MSHLIHPRSLRVGVVAQVLVRSLLAALACGLVLLPPAYILYRLSTTPFHTLFNNEAYGHGIAGNTTEDVYTVPYNGREYLFVRVNEDPLLGYVLPNTTDEYAYRTTTATTATTATTTTATTARATTATTATTRLFQVKTKLCANASAIDFCVPPLGLLYSAPATHSVRLVDNINTIPPAARYISPHGIAAHCDWVLISRMNSNPLGVFGTTLSPTTIYVQTKLLSFFAFSLLPRLTVPFVLFTACNDYTVPTNTDKWYGKRSTEMEWGSIVGSKLLVHWYAENKVGSHPKVSTLPIGNELAINVLYMK
jgi:hypothetical protein